MDIILDSNIFRGDFLLRSKDFEVLLDYLKKTESSIIIPQIILDEVSGLYKRTLDERTAAYNKAANNVNLTLKNPALQIADLVLDKDICLSEYIEHIKERLKIQERNILPYKESFLTEIASRAISRKNHRGMMDKGFGIHLFG